LGPRIANPKIAKKYVVCKSEIRKLQKVYGPQIGNPQIATFAEGPQGRYDNPMPELTLSSRQDLSIRLQVCEPHFVYPLKHVIYDSYQKEKGEYKEGGGKRWKLH
jgi:hypothetical protein